MSPLLGIQKKIADKFLRMTISGHIKKRYSKKGITPTVEQVMQDIPATKMIVLLQNGYTREEITGIGGEVIRRQKK